MNLIKIEKDIIKILGTSNVCNICRGKYIRCYEESFKLIPPECKDMAANLLKLDNTIRNYIVKI